MDLKKIEENICKTGFKLEHEIASTLRAEGWSLITNRYYLDDHEESVREIDILAYKFKNVAGVSIYTVIIISCKKSESNNWALLSRNFEYNDPSAKLNPFQGYSNNAVVSYFLEQDDWAKNYYEHMLKKSPGIFEKPMVDIFAFQEISKEKSTCQNDKNIFNAITSLMKSQAYEINSLRANRIKNRSVFYQFNLISIIDSELVRVKFENEEIEASVIDSDDYISKYILNKKESVSRIKFLTAKKFKDSIKSYSTLHAENSSFINELDSLFFRDILHARDRTKILLPNFKEKAKQHLWYPYYVATKTTLDIEGLGIEFNKKTEEAVIEIDTSISNIAELNGSKSCINAAKKILLEVYRYEGEVCFEVMVLF